MNEELRYLIDIDPATVWLSGDTKKPIVEMPILREGEWRHPQAPGGKLSVDDGLMTELVMNFAAGVSGSKVPTDVGAMAHKPVHDDCPAWLVGVEKKGKELWGKFQVVDAGLADKITGERVQFFSPSLRLNWTDPADGAKKNAISGGSWTNYPFIKGLQPAQIVNLSEFGLGDETELGDQALDDIRAAVQNAVSGAAGRSTALPIVEGVEGWVEKLYPDYAIVRRDDKYYRVGYTLAEDGAAILGEWTQVEQSWEPVGLADADDDGEGGDQDTPKKETPPKKEDADTLPRQCLVCAKRDDGCPFGSSETKESAAGEGNCPQYVDEESRAKVGQGGSNVDKSEQDQTKLSEQDQEARIARLEAELKVERGSRVQLAEQSAVRDDVEFADRALNEGRMTPVQHAGYLKIRKALRQVGQTVNLSEITLAEGEEPVDLAAEVQTFVENAAATVDMSAVEYAPGMPAVDPGDNGAARRMKDLIDKGKDPKEAWREAVGSAH